MKKKSFNIVFALVLVLGLSLGAALPAAAATTWTVDDDLVEYPDADFTTIQAAITAAADGDTIEVYDGTYGKVVINKELAIQAAAGNSPIVDGGGSGACLGIYKAAGMSDVTIDGFEIQNATYGIWIYGAPSTYSNITLSNNYIHNHSQNGILVTDSTVNNLIILDNNIDSSGIGISFANNSTVDGLTVEGNTVTNNNAGLSLIQGAFSNVAITDCYFEGNAWEHIDLGLWGNNPSLSSVLISGCQFLSGPWSAIYVDSTFASGDIVLRCNEFYSGPYIWGVFNLTSNFVDAICNWWGAIDGPSGIGPGSGAIVWDNVYYEPWLVSSDGPCYGYDGIADCFQNIKNHGQFVSCIAKFTQGLVKDGTITTEERVEIVNWAAQSDIGK
ncbi:MAG: right-handed parallel beta-helix repeat-containing protein [Dehalococcoidales bacterium]|nr:right-handed parallel beta-helix repeat-containing protein [Dehalococcoidales bacterium]